MKFFEYLKNLLKNEYYCLERYTDDGIITSRGVYENEEEANSEIAIQVLTLRNNLMKVGYTDKDFELKNENGCVVLSWNKGRDYVQWRITHNALKLTTKS